MIASKSASSSANDVSIRQARSGSWSRSSRHTVTPSPSGRRTSSTATSGRTAGTRARASAAVEASPTTAMSPSLSRRSRTPRRTTSWSSSRKTRIGVGVATASFSRTFLARTFDSVQRRRRARIVESEEMTLLSTTDRARPDTAVQRGATRARPPGGSVVLFFVLAYAFSWAWVMPWAATGHTVTEGHGWPTHMPALVGPLLAALVVVVRREGRGGAADLLRRMVRWRIGWRWWLVALSPLAMLVVTLPVLVAAGVAPPADDFARYSGLPAGLGLV